MRHGDRQRKTRGESGKPVVLLARSASADSVEQGSRTARSSPTRHSWLSQPRAEPHGAIGQVGVLVAQQILGQFRGDLDLGAGHADPRWPTGFAVFRFERDPVRGAGTRGTAPVGGGVPG